MNRNWIALHIYYASNGNPVLIDCIEPLVASLREQGLIRRFFFLRYWLEGPHLRFRVLPAQGVDPDQVRHAVRTEVERYLTVRPALYEVDEQGIADFYKRMYLVEYGEERWNQQYGEGGRMPIRPNNTCHFIDYEPEYDRYGGPEGIELSEWQFEKSSEVVLHLLGVANVHVRTVMLGLSIQLAGILCYAFLRDEEAIAGFLRTYRQFWESNYQNQENKDSEYERNYQKMRPSLTGRMATVRRGVLAGERSSLTPVEQRWADHLDELRQRIVSHATAGRLQFGWSREELASGGTDPVDAALRYLMSSYIHMTNNRLGVTVLDEIYLSYLLQRTMEDVREPVMAG